MKKIAYIIIGVLLLAGLGWAYYAYAAYLPTYSRHVAETVLIDQTQEFLVQPTGTEILSLASLPGHKWESVQLQMRTFSEYKYTESYGLALQGQFFLLSNPDDRDKEIAAFILKTDTVISRIREQNKGYPKSSIYAPFIEEVNRISATKADIKTVLAYTDACENTSVFSVYNAKDRELLIRHPEKVKELLSQYGKPGNLHGVVIYIFFKPKSDRDNEYFTIMSGFYKMLFETAGADVYVGPNLVVDNDKL
ncbi:MAG: hypothetical protein JWQ38_345 [Flavipsychrobacter sp.]|nr:hypothetical protein [Flavipsychrobacter sp.]